MHEPRQSVVVAQPTLEGSGWTRRAFVQSLGGIMAATNLLPGAAWAASPVSERATIRPKTVTPRPRYRAVSWWLTLNDLAWPNPELMDNIRRRADTCAANGVNCCTIFGAHMRWDFLPIWGRLHDEIRFIADELHQRKILLFDHHSAGVVQRPRNPAEALNVWHRNRHHLPFYPNYAEAATWQFAGSHLNDWRMLDLATGKPAYLPAYNAEQFCPNHPDFQAAYQTYVRRLLADTGIDGLMSDDAIFYADWHACGCHYCRVRFKQDYGHTLPPVSDAAFWGDRRNPAFRDWITLRYHSTRDFLGLVRAAVPAGFPLLTCCSSSDNYYLPGFGMSYQDFIQNCNHVMLEMCGSTPTLKGTWDDRVPSQWLHLDIARAHAAPCFGLGYGFFPDTAFFIWAVNKFLGSDCWFSTLKGRLDISPAELNGLADDPELVGEGYLWEMAHPDLFLGEVVAPVAILFSRATRDFYGEMPGDYSNDYNATCLALMQANLPVEVRTEIPLFGQTKALCLSGVMCLARDQRAALESFMTAGGLVIATGPTGYYDAAGNRSPQSWFDALGLAVELVEPARPGSFPPYQNFPKPVPLAKCHLRDAVVSQMSGGWFNRSVGQGWFFWRPERMAEPALSPSVIAVLAVHQPAAFTLAGLPATWRTRSYQHGNRLLIHCLPAQVETVLHPTLQNHFNQERLVQKLRYEPLKGRLVVSPPTRCTAVWLHSPDLPAARPAQPIDGGGWSVDATLVSRYFILECVV